MIKDAIIITGTSSGIGLGLTKYYLENGYKVIGLARRNPLELSSYNNYAHISIDITDPIAISIAFDKLLKEIVNIKLIVLNAGVLGSIDRMESISIKDSKNVLETNLWANKSIIDKLILSKTNLKQVIAISSGASKNGSAGWGPYSVSKAALNILINTYSKENTKIHFSSIAPGLVDTAMQEHISSLENNDNFESINRIQAAKGTSDMPLPSAIAKDLAIMFERIYTNEISGEFFDIRNY